VVLVVGVALVVTIGLLATMGTGVSVTSSTSSPTAPAISPVGQSGLEALTARGPTLSSWELLLISLTGVAVWVATALLLLRQRRVPEG
jgi:hypothetical protein